MFLRKAGLQIVVTETQVKLMRLTVGVIGGTVVVGLALFAFANIYGPETYNLVFGGAVEGEDGLSAEDQSQAVSDCLRDREWREDQFIEKYGEVEIPAEAVWGFATDEEASLELWKQRQSPVGFERLRAARVDAGRLSNALSETGNQFGAEVFPDRRYLFTVDRTTQTTIGADTLVTASGFLRVRRVLLVNGL